MKGKRPLRRVAGNLTGATSAGAASDQIMAWHILSPVQWPYRSATELEGSITQVARSLAAITGEHGREIMLRVSSADYPVTEWAAALDADTPDPVDSHAWLDYLADSQKALFDHPMSEPVCFLGVEVGHSGWLTRARGLRRDQDAVVEDLSSRLSDELAQVTGALAPVATPARQREVEWLIHRSVGLGLPAPLVRPGTGYAPLGEDDLPGVFSSVEYHPGRPFARAVRVAGAPGRNGGAEVDRYVTVLSLGRMEEQSIPERDSPWMARALQFGGVEMSLRGKLLPGRVAASEVGRKIDRLLDEQDQRAAHGRRSTPSRLHTIDHAIHVQDTMREAWSDDAVVFKGWVRFAIDGATPAEARARANALTLHMAKQRIDLGVLGCQEDAAREFTPGEPVATTEYTRRLPLRLLAAGMPQATASVGDRRGLHTGYVVGAASHTPFMWDLHHAMEENDWSGVTPVVGEMGCGKSYVLHGLLGLSTLRGAYATGVDPAGTGCGVTLWEPISKHSAVLDVMSTEFSPYAVFPEARQADFYDHPEVLARDAETGNDQPGRKLTREATRLAWELSVDAEKLARHERSQLTLDCLRGVLHPGTAQDPETELLLSEAIHAHNDARASSSVPGVLRELRVAARKANSHEGTRLADALDRIADLPAARNWMQAGAQPTSKVGLVEARLLMLKMSDVSLPRDPDPLKWSPSERLRVPLLGLAMHYAYARMFRRPRAERKVLTFDESWLLENWPSWQALIANVERQCRRWNIRAFIASQDPATTLLAQDASKSLIGDVWGGYTADPQAQVKLAEMMRLDRSFEREFASLRVPGEVAEDGAKRRDWLVRINGEKGRVRFTLPPDLAALLDTTPHQVTARDLVLDRQEGWFTR